MARPLRINEPDALYHVMARGIDRRTIFKDDRDRCHFVDLLAVLPERFRVVVLAYVCMDSHSHLAAVGMALRRLERTLPTNLGLQQMKARMVEMLDVKRDPNYLTKIS